MLIFPAVGEPTSIIQMPTFLDGWSAAQNWVSDIRPRTQDLGRFRRQSHQGAEARTRQDRHGRARRPARSRRLAAARCPHAADRAAAQGARSSSSTTCWRRSAPSRATRSLAFCARPRSLGDLMLATCRDVARPGVKECEVYARHDADDDRERRRGADLVPVELRSISLSASVPRADDAADGKGRSDHLRDAPEDSAATSPMSSAPICLGEPEKEQLEIYEGCFAAYRVRPRAFRSGQDDLDRAAWR